MTDYLNIKDPKWLGGENVRWTVTIALLSLVAWKVGAFKK